MHRNPPRLGRVPMEMLVHRPHLEREFGMSRITGTVMDLTDSAARTVLRMEGTAEFFSFPQRYALGVDGDDFADTFRTYLNRFLALGRDTEGGLPQLGQFTASSPQPHIEQLRAVASLFSGETSIPLNYLGIVHDNPSSADAIRAAEADLITVTERAQRIYGAAWARVMGLARKVRDGAGAPAPRLRVQWRDPATPTKAANAQSVMALVSAGVLPAMSEVTWELLGYDEATITRLSAVATRAGAQATLAELATGAAAPDPEADALAGRVDLG
ncbi:phage portal protein [Corynebacterium sphenisci]|uniref:phage portal protein n=1 Tax=Corynebacterium sphenisci TaxID=191493 RepID=UPI000951325A|nr:phage portal protein [Corynebacterium sphenisci]